jgi:hypothetical protein
MTGKVRRIATVAVLLTIAVNGIAQKTRQKTATRNRPVFYSIHAGQTMRVRLNKALGSETSHVGEYFTSTLVDPLYSSSGVLLVPQGSTINGKVTHIQRAQKNGEPGTMDVVFTSIRLPNAYIRGINGTLTDLSSSGGSSDNEGTVTAKKTSNRNVKFIGGGAAGGAVIGAIAGGGKGFLIGAGIGALAGGITGRVKKGGEVKVSSGTEFGVILNQAVTFPKYVARAM